MGVSLNTRRHAIKPPQTIITTLEKPGHLQNLEYLWFTALNLITGRETGSLVNCKRQSLGFCHFSVTSSKWRRVQSPQLSAFCYLSRHISLCGCMWCLGALCHPLFGSSSRGQREPSKIHLPNFKTSRLPAI